MKKKDWIWILGGGVVLLYFLNQQTGQGGTGSGMLPSGGGYGGMGFAGGAPRRRFRI